MSEAGRDEGALESGDPADRIRVLLVDDHSAMRAGFRMILGSAKDIEIVGEAGTGAGAVAEAARLEPDVICMDVQMPDMDGIAATAQIIRSGSAARVLIVTTFDRDDYLFNALEAGASGFVLKNAGPEELISAVHTIAAGDGLLAPAVTRRVIERFAADSSAGADRTEDVDRRAPGAHGGTHTGVEEREAGVVGTVRGAAGPKPVPTEATGSIGTTGPPHATGPVEARPAPGETAIVVGDPPVELTEREAEVLRLLARAFSNGEIAAELFIGEATVKTHVSNLLQKIGARDRVAAVVYAHRHGLA